MFSSKIISAISWILACAISAISFFLIFLKFWLSKNLSSISSFSKFFEKSELNNIFSTVSFFKAIIFDMSLFTVFAPNSKRWKNFKDEFSKKITSELSLLISILKNVSKLWLFLIVFTPSKNFFEIILFTFRLQSLNIFLKFL